MDGLAIDTSGAVWIESPAGADKYLPTALGAQYEWADLSPFEQGYAEAMLRDSPNKIGRKLGAYMGRPGFSDLAGPTLAAMLKDCDRRLEVFRGPNNPIEGGAFWRMRQAGQYHTYFEPVILRQGSDGLIYQGVA